MSPLPMRDRDDARLARREEHEVRAPTQRPPRHASAFAFIVALYATSAAYA